MSELTNKRRLRQMLGKIERHKTAIAQHRDALREVIEDVEAIVGSIDEGCRLLEAAIDELSGYL